MALGSVRALSRLSRTGPVRCGSRHRDHEPRALADPVALGVDVAAVRFGDRARDRKADPAASGRPRPCRIRAEEPLEHPLEVLGSDPFPGVGYDELDLLN